MNLNLSIHGHFYQPPREDPISDYIPDEIGAEPYHNWNERIMAECYEPNARAGNFGKISFNIGPTHFNRMQQTFPDVTELIVTRRVISNGMVMAMAWQAYNHAILPLATRLDKIASEHWGWGTLSATAQRRIWLPETAADTEALRPLRPGAKVHHPGTLAGQRGKKAAGRRIAWSSRKAGRISPSSHTIGT